MNNRSFVQVFSARDHQVVFLMMHAERQNAEKAETAQLFQILRGRMDNEIGPVLEFGGFEAPAIDAIHRRGVGRGHASNRVADRPVPREGENHAAVDGYVGHFGIERDIVHVDEMLPERIDIDLRPVRLGVRRQNFDNLLNRGERVLSGSGGDQTGLSLRGYHDMLLPRHRYILPMLHVMDGLQACGLLKIRLRERGGGSKATDQN